VAETSAQALGQVNQWSNYGGGGGLAPERPGGPRETSGLRRYKGSFRALKSPLISPINPRLHRCWYRYRCFLLPEMWLLGTSMEPQRKNFYARYRSPYYKEDYDSTTGGNYRLNSRPWQTPGWSRS